MSLDATQVRVGITGHIYKAPVGTDAPDGVDELATPWKELGYSETGPSLSVDTSKESFTPWQSLSPVRETITGQVITASFTLWQRNADTLREAWGGGTVIAGTDDGVRIFSPPSVPTINEGAYIFDVIDGLIIDRYYIERASSSLDGEVPFAKDGVTSYTIGLTYLAPASGGSPWKLITNDAAVELDEPVGD
jgi:hypothetical protein